MANYHNKLRAAIPGPLDRGRPARRPGSIPMFDGLTVRPRHDKAHFDSEHVAPPPTQTKDKEPHDE